MGPARRQNSSCPMAAAGIIRRSFLCFTSPHSFLFYWPHLPPLLFLPTPFPHTQVLAAFVNKFEAFGEDMPLATAGGQGIPRWNDTASCASSSRTGMLPAQRGALVACPDFLDDVEEPLLVSDVAAGGWAGGWGAAHRRG